MPAIGGNRECERPGCTDDADKRYEGPEDNTLRLCPSCYYRLVTRGKSLSDPLGLGTDELRNCISPPISRGMPVREEYDTGPDVDDLSGVTVGTGSGDTIRARFQSVKRSDIEERTE